MASTIGSFNNRRRLLMTPFANLLQGQFNYLGDTIAANIYTYIFIHTNLRGNHVDD